MMIGWKGNAKGKGEGEEDDDRLEGEREGKGSGKGERERDVRKVNRGEETEGWEKYDEVLEKKKEVKGEKRREGMLRK